MNFVFAFLTGMGVGTGGLYVLWLTLVKDIPQAEAQGMNLIFFSLSILSASIINLFFKRVMFAPILIILIFGLAVTYPASCLANTIDSSLLTRLFGGFLIVLGSVGFFGKNK